MPAQPEDIKAAQRVIGATPDGAFGARSVEALVEYLRGKGELRPPATTPDARMRVVEEARAHVGTWTEADVQELWREVGVSAFAAPGQWHTIAWCGGYALRCLRRALGLDWTWKVGLGFLEVHGMPKVSLPEPGDIAYFAKNQHHAIVADVGVGKVTLVNGNGMPSPLEGVTVTTRPIADATAYYSIARVLP